MSYPQPAPFGAPPPAKPGSSSTTTVVIVLVVGGVAVLSFLCIALLLALMIPAAMAGREAARKAQSMNNLKQIGIALHNYHDTHQTLPPAFIADSDGKPRTSWRTMLLPFIGAQPQFQQYNFSVPWDHADNAAVRQMDLNFYKSARADNPRPNLTNYVVVTSQNHPDPNAQTAFPGGEPRSLRDIIDGTTKTIFVLEIRNSDIEWAEPRDIDIDSLSTDPAAPNSIDLASGAVVLMGDASVRNLPPNTSLETLKKLLKVRDGEAVPGF